MRDLLHWVHIGPDTRRDFTISLEFVPQDMWIGAFWRARPDFPMFGWTRRDVWLCLVPTLPIHIVYYQRPSKRKRGAA